MLREPNPKIVEADFWKNEVALARYLRGVGFKALQRTH
jgi:hypothetical protein